MAFGFYLIYQKIELEKTLSISVEPLILNCLKDMRPFDYWRLGKFTEVDLKEMEKAAVHYFKAGNVACETYIKAIKEMNA